METLTVKNKRLKMSANGVISLPVAARKGLGMTKDEPLIIGISTDGKSIILTGSPQNREKTCRVSKKGIIVLRGKERELLLKSENHHYWLEINDSNKEVRLLPF